MMELIKLNKKNISALEKLNESRLLFNEVNEDFLSLYNNCNIAQQFLLRNKVRLLKHNCKIIGYLWYTVIDKSTCFINSMYIDNSNLSDVSIIDLYGIFINYLKARYVVKYYCECNSINFNILNKLGFCTFDGVIEMKCKINNITGSSDLNNVNFEILKKGTHEALRCKIQNEVFRNEARMPLEIEDMYFDELQNYYFDEGAIFIKLDDIYIGYGQVIIDNNCAIIVNVGILSAYRGKGYGKKLLYQLIEIIRINGYEDVSIKVATNNCIALNLYKSMGFSVYKESYDMMIKRSR
jgi:ribosomal protein S18 acetylase RimI-like enzyme